ncbi:MAG: hypothetical protein GX928_07085 [Ruminococcaceae bacterium]|nr:hypothetical protein [Oscillospiraceae bacterium]
MKKRFSFSSLFDNKIFVLILSLAIAIGAWLIVSFNIYPEMEITIKKVEVLKTEADAAYRSRGLNIVDAEDDFVDITVKGARGLLQTLTAQDIRVVPIYSSVEAPGIYNLPLTASRVDAQKNFQITGISPKDVTVKFDVAKSEKFPISANVIGLSAAEDMILGTISVFPGDLTINAPEGEIDRIERVVVEYDLNETLTESRTIMQLPITIYDVNGNVMDLKNMTLSSETAEITIPVLKQGTMKLDIAYLNVPEGFNTDTLTYVMSVDEISVAAVESIIDNMGTQIVGYIDLAQFEIGKSTVFDLNLSSAFTNLSGVDSITVTFPKDKLSSDKIRVTDLRVVNASEEFEVTIDNQSVSNVTVIGPEEELAQLLPTSVLGVVDLGMMALKEGSSQVYVKFIIPSSDSVWVAGSYSVVITVKQK